jgi:hypothetical protein
VARVSSAIDPSPFLLRFLACNPLLCGGGAKAASVLFSLECTRFFSMRRSLDICFFFSCSNVSGFVQALATVSMVFQSGSDASRSSFGVGIV